MTPRDTSRKLQEIADRFFNDIARENFSVIDVATLIANLPCAYARGFTVIRHKTSV